MIAVRRYTSTDAPAWDACVRASRTPLFLFERGYMDYHADRFADHSVLIEDDGRLIGVLPAHTRSAEADSVDYVSHGGLSFGGLLMARNTKTADVLDSMAALVMYGRDHGWRDWIYKAVPHFYAHAPAEDDRYALWRLGATLAGRTLALAVDLASEYGTPSRRMGGVKTAQARGVQVVEYDDLATSPHLATFWDMLTARLATAHEAAPVHTLDEMRLLCGRFAGRTAGTSSGRIRLFAAEHAAVLIGGVLVYDYDHAARAQYIATTDAGRALAAVDLIVFHLLTAVYRSPAYRYFDLGTSTRPHSETINAGLYAQKEKFGGRPVPVDVYRLSFATSPLETLDVWT